MSRQFDEKNASVIIEKREVVMSDSERPLLKEIIRRVAHLKPKKVLEVGYGLGISARLIQKHLRPVHHHIVEIDDKIYKDLKKFAKSRPGVVGILGDWMTFKPKTKYDFLFLDSFEYDDVSYPGDPDWLEAIAEKSRRLQRLLKVGGILCEPQFDHQKPDRLPGMKLAKFEKIKTSPFLLWDGRRTTKGGYCCWQRVRKKKAK